MTRATLVDVLGPALDHGYAVAGFVCLGWEDARAYATAAERECAPVILQVGPGARGHMPLPIWARMLGTLADQASVPVVIHLDHSKDISECESAIQLGFTSVMFDGSDLALDENIERTRQVVQMAHRAGVSCEGEIGYVGYDNGAASLGTQVHEANQFAHNTGVDAMAISIGNVHLQQSQKAVIDYDRLSKIQSETPVPLVLHGGSGIAHQDRIKLASTSNVCKFNMGTELRQVFGQSLRKTLAQFPNEFDRIKILHTTEAPLCAEAQKIIRELGPVKK